MFKKFLSVIFLSLCFSQIYSIEQSQNVFTFPSYKLLSKFLPQDESQIALVIESYFYGRDNIEKKGYLNEEDWKQILSIVEFSSGIEVLNDKIIRELGIVASVQSFEINGRFYTYDEYLNEHKAYLYCLKAIGHKNILGLLVSIPYVLDINYKFIKGDTLLDKALENDFKEGIELIKERGGVVGKKTRKPLKRNRDETEHKKKNRCEFLAYLLANSPYSNSSGTI